jgi:hypothetical protein
MKRIALALALFASLLQPTACQAQFFGGGGGGGVTSLNSQTGAITTYNGLLPLGFQIYLPTGGTKPSFLDCLYVSNIDQWVTTSQGVFNSTADTNPLFGKQLSGNFTITALAINFGDGQGLGGASSLALMSRDSMAPGSKFAAILVQNAAGTVTPYSVYRTTLNGAFADTAGTAVSFPYYIRLQRVGNVFTFYVSPDNVTYTLIDTQTITLNAAQIVGLIAVDSNSIVGGAGFENGYFSGVTISQP